MKTILVTAIGTMTSASIVSWLKKSGEYRLIGGNLFKAHEVATSKDVDEYYELPSVVDCPVEYLNCVLGICKRCRVDYYFASIDEEVVLLSRNRKLFEAEGVRLCIANAELIETCHYKNKFSAWLHANLPEVAIKTYSGFDIIPDSDYPVFIKPVEGRASIGCRKVVSRCAALKVLKEGLDESDFVIQEFCEGEHITVDLLRNAATAEVLQLQRRELLRNANGCGIAVEIIADEKLERICRELAWKLELNGVVNVEFFKNGDIYRCIEVNPRFSAGTDYSCMAGLNTVLNALNIAEGKGCCLGMNCLIGKHFAKRYETCQMD